jgi:hypothetical protein
MIIVSISGQGDHKMTVRKQLSFKRHNTAAFAMVHIINDHIIICTGTNGDREMIASLMMANFEVFDVTMSDLQSKKITLDVFQGLVFPGGFSYAGTYFFILKN